MSKDLKPFINASDQNNLRSTQDRYEEYEIESISLYESLHDFSHKETSFYQKLNAYLPTIQAKKAALVDNEVKLKQNIKDYNLLLWAWSNNADEMTKLNIDISIEIHLIWRVHLLSTSQYYVDCMEHFGELINYKPTNISMKEMNSESFHLILSPLIPIDAYKKEQNRVLSIEFNVFKQMLFEYCAFITDFGVYVQNDGSFDVDKAMVRYRYFMYLRYISNENRSNLCLVATADILLLWHCHIIYNSSNYLDFSIQLFGSTTMLKYDFVCIQSAQNMDIQQTETLWDTYFGIGSYRDHTFNNHGNMNALQYDMHVKRQDDMRPNKGFCYDRRNRSCVLCMCVIGCEIVMVVICMCMFLFRAGMGLVPILIVFIVATLFILLVAFIVSVLHKRKRNKLNVIEQKMELEAVMDERRNIENVEHIHISEGNVEKFINVKNVMSGSVQMTLAGDEIKDNDHNNNKQGEQSVEIELNEVIEGDPYISSSSSSSGMYVPVCNEEVKQTKTKVKETPKETSLV
eukprot:57932_1